MHPKILGRRAARLVANLCYYALHRLWRICCRTLPAHWAFTWLVVIDAVFPGRGFQLGQIFMPYAARALRLDPGYRFAGRFAKTHPYRAASVLFHIGLYAQCAELLLDTELATRSAAAGSLLTASLFELEEFARAREAVSLWYSSSDALQWRGILELLSNNEDAALPFLMAVANELPHLMRPHQNLAARNSTAYVPNLVDMSSAREGRLYDFYNYLGQRVTHVGAGHLAVPLYKKAFRAQRQLRAELPKLSELSEVSARLQSIANSLGASLPTLKILPDEWVTQIGHLGMLDVLFKMRRLGWWDGTAVLLACYNKIANQPYLSLFEEECRVQLLKDDYADGAYGEFASLQRHCGLSFNAFTMPDGWVVPWQDAGALLAREWEARRLGHPAGQRYDRILGSRSDVQEGYARLRAAAGMRESDWFVCLHLRDASYYGEVETTGQTHRNAALGNYLPAIQHITQQGGFVIKLGGRSSPALPRMERVYDYSHSMFKSDILDLHLIRNARYFIGTTSGLTHVPLSFGVPCALVNCVTIDAQLWGQSVRFALKPIVARDGRMLSQRNLTSTPWRWRLFSANVMHRHGISAMDNDADDILETVKEVESVVVDGGASYATAYPDCSSLLSMWQTSLAVPHFYGNSKPSLYFLKKHSRSFFDPSDEKAPAAAQ